MAIDVRTFLGLESTEHPLHWRLPVTRGLSTAGGFLFGGVGLAAGVEAMESVTGRPAIWAAAQYLSYAPTGSVVDFEVTVAVSGHHISQARCMGRVDGNEILTINAALGRRPAQTDGVWTTRPDLPRPEVSPVRAVPAVFEGTINHRLDVRMALGRSPDQLDGTQGDGASALWVRMPEVLEVSAAALAVFGDLVPSGIGQALGRYGGGNSLDNTLRMIQLVPTEWVLVDVHIQAVHNGFGHGLAHLWAEDGTLLGTASQSVVVRHWKDRQPPKVIT
jgi:acyl-CoA thioesterase-2